MEANMQNCQLFEMSAQFLFNLRTQSSEERNFYTSKHSVAACFISLVNSRRHEILASQEVSEFKLIGHNWIFHLQYLGRKVSFIGVEKYYIKRKREEDLKYIFKEVTIDLHFILLFILRSNGLTTCAKFES